MAQRSTVQYSVVDLIALQYGTCDGNTSVYYLIWVPLDYYIFSIVSYLIQSHSILHFFID